MKNKNFLVAGVIASIYGQVLKEQIELEIKESEEQIGFMTGCSC